MRFNTYFLLITIPLFIVSSPASSETAKDFLTELEKEVPVDTINTPKFNAQNGELFFKSKQGLEWSCSSCHTENPLNDGVHIVTQKTIQPLSPVSNPTRFTDKVKVDKWFKRNCKDVVGRECTTEEKGNILTYLMSLKSPIPQ
jgi:Domain of unknown function (DUF1924)